MYINIYMSIYYTYIKYICDVNFNIKVYNLVVLMYVSYSLFYWKIKKW